MARGRGNINSASLRHIQGKSKWLRDPQASLAAMNLATQVYYYPGIWGLKHSLRIMIDPTQYRQILQGFNAYSRNSIPLIKLEADNARDLQSQININTADLAAKFGLPAGIDDLYWRAYWQQITDRVRKAIDDEETENRLKNQHLGVKHMKMRFEKGRLLMIRLGPLSPQVQDDSIGRLSPEKKGVWAFPYPYFEMFFAAHQIDKGMPKKLTTSPDDEDSEEIWQAWHTSRDEWAKAHAPKPKTFWYGGDIYTHYNRQGQYIGLAWEKMSANEFYQMAKKIVPGRNQSNDELELFLPGKERGRV